MTANPKARAKHIADIVRRAKLQGSWNDIGNWRSDHGQWYSLPEQEYGA